MSRNHVRQNHMRILFLLDILAGSKHVGIYDILQLAALCTKQAYGGGACMFCQVHSVDHVRRIATGADAEYDVTRFDHVGKLLGKNMFVSSIVTPGGD